MQFGYVPLDQAEGAILAHSLKTTAGRVRKGAVLDAETIAELVRAGYETVMTARLEDGDLREDDAARGLAEGLTSENLVAGTPGTGRCSLFATKPGLFRVDKARVDAFNEVDEGITLATLPDLSQVAAGQMAATVKIIPFAVPRDRVAACLDGSGPGTVAVAPFRPLRAVLLQTAGEGDKPSLIEKTIEATRARLSAIGAALVDEHLCPHREDAVAAALKEIADRAPDVVLILGASAIVDRRDVVPTALEQAGGRIEHFGMPVDPGNLTLVAALGNIPVLGLPGSARSPRPHGFDWILQRIAADIPVTGQDIMAMGVGGLLKEIPGRPMPRLESAPPAETVRAETPRIRALVLAAGQSRRMGRVNKLLEHIQGTPLVRRVVDATLASRAIGVTVVTGHQEERVRTALEGLDIDFAHNPDYGGGLSTSLRAGVSALPEETDGVVVCLGDMPKTTPAVIDALIDAYDPDVGHEICVPTRDGKRGNPVLWGRRFFPALQTLSGDVGARHLIGENAEFVQEVPIDDDAIFVDLDTPEALAAYRTADG